jgi:hypothetical protein
MIFILTNALHYKSELFAHDDAFFLKPEFRKGTAGIKMIRAAEQMLQTKGVKRVIFHIKNRLKNGKVFEFLGYKPRETNYMKEI